jgi:AmmeMemoRadiSam system protein B/AmmeMemoRadiSam system protein A
MSGQDFQSTGARPAAVAGSWYPEEPGHLTSQVEVMLDAARPWRRSALLRALVVPHAGLRYSGPTAAHGYVAAGRDHHQRVVVLAPNHRFPLTGAAVDPSSHYESPLGRVAVDLEAVEALASQPHFVCSPRPFAQEHAIEMQLPFLQHRLPRATLVPVLVGELRGDEFDEVAASLSALLDARTLFVISSDFMHYGKAFGYVPFVDRVEENIRSFDAQAIDAITRGSFDDFHSVLERTGNTICGRRPLGVLLQMLPRTWKGELRGYTTSGTITGDWSHSVSYAALAFTEGDDESEKLAAEAEEMVREADRMGSFDAGSPLDSPWPRDSIPEQDQRTLLRLARESVTHAAHGTSPPSDLYTASELSPRLNAPRAAFVSLHTRRSGRLRGCIGWLEARKALVDAVVENARAAATRDPRFAAVAPEEVEDLDIEISVLGPLLDVEDVAEIEVGRDGLLIDMEARRGILLPQVPVQLHWGREEFLDNVCRKAGLPADAWKRGARIQRFEAVVFSEAELEIT